MPNNIRSLLGLPEIKPYHTDNTIITRLREDVAALEYENKVFVEVIERRDKELAAVQAELRKCNRRRPRSFIDWLMGE